jgi:hypothetical protein
VWYSATYTEIGQNKLGNMDKNGFEGIIAEFSTQFENKAVGSGDRTAVSLGDKEQANK